MEYRTIISLGLERRGISTLKKPYVSFLKTFIHHVFIGHMWGDCDVTWKIRPYLCLSVAFTTLCIICWCCLTLRFSSASPNLANVSIEMASTNVNPYQIPLCPHLCGDLSPPQHRERAHDRKSKGGLCVYVIDAFCSNADGQCLPDVELLTRTCQPCYRHRLVASVHSHPDSQQ